MPSNHLVLCRPPSPPALISIFPRIRVYSNELALHIRWSNYWNFTFSISPFNEYSRLISFRIDWFDLLVVQGILKSLLQHHSSKTSVLWCSVFFMVQLSHPYQTTGKNIALTFVSKVMFLLFNMLSRFIIAFLPRSKHLLISSLKSPSAVLLEPKKIKSATVSISPPYICFPSDASGKEPSYQWRQTRDVGSIPFHPGKIPRRRKWKPTSVFLPGKSHEQRSLAGYSPYVCTELDTTEATQHCTFAMK